MRRVLAMLFVSVVGFACASGSGKEEDPKHEWHELMEEIEGFQYDTLKHAAADPGKANLSTIASSAREVAAELRSEAKTAMPGDALFAQLAAEAAKWFDDVASAASAGPADLGATLSRFPAIERDVCKKCHDRYQDKW